MDNMPVRVNLLHIIRRGKEAANNLICRVFLNGNVVNWERATWKLNNVTILNMKKETVCNIPVPRDVLFQTKRTYNDHKLLCNTLNGKMTVINSSALQYTLIEEFKKKITDLSIFARVK